MLTFTCELDLALTYSMRNPRLARKCALAAYRAAVAIRRPDLAAAANDVLAAIGGN